MHDPDYRASWKDFETFLDAMTQGITTIDETVPELPLKDIGCLHTSHVRLLTNKRPIDLSHIP